LSGETPFHDQGSIFQSSFWLSGKFQKKITNKFSSAYFQTNYCTTCVKEVWIIITRKHGSLYGTSICGFAGKGEGQGHLCFYKNIYIINVFIILLLYNFSAHKNDHSVRKNCLQIRKWTHWRRELNCDHGWSIKLTPELESWTTAMADLFFFYGSPTGEACGKG
jgi:hypothetical protein